MNPVVPFRSLSHSTYQHTSLPEALPLQIMALRPPGTLLLGLLCWSLISLTLLWSVLGLSPQRSSLFLLQLPIFISTPVNIYSFSPNSSFIGTSWIHLSNQLMESALGCQTNISNLTTLEPDSEFLPVTASQL